MNFALTVPCLVAPDHARIFWASRSFHCSVLVSRFPKTGRRRLPAYHPPAQPRRPLWSHLSPRGCLQVSRCPPLPAVLVCVVYARVRYHDRVRVVINPLFAYVFDPNTFFCLGADQWPFRFFILVVRVCTIMIVYVFMINIVCMRLRANSRSSLASAAACACYTKNLHKIRAGVQRMPSLVWIRESTPIDP